MAATVNLRHLSSIVDADTTLSVQATVLAELGCVEVAVTNPRRSFRLVDAWRRQETAPEWPEGLRRGSGGLRC